MPYNWHILNEKNAISGRVIIVRNPSTQTPLLVSCWSIRINLPHQFQGPDQSGQPGCFA
jgi:hypothetical protein